ncbi:filamentous hemagglutinin N-terminal domain-containing protein, partial [Vibrio kasasachensis]|uniref:filamentous hemagglutinin N-terminal domain-containing protein n=1 Tax=Vibrio kasasachensis TaxID=2910248 RepID=UPI003D0B74E8
MTKPISPFARYSVYFVLAVFNTQPVLANVVVDGTNTVVTSAPNGTEVVNIAKPNSQGLSHNKYELFNVDKSGLVLNNSIDQFGVSELAGVLEANLNLQGKAADVILNEVTSANRSQLEGYTEVFGQQANVIISNPYGITCDGCGFINTPRVTLATGAPHFDNEEFVGFDVQQGKINIEGLGLDASRQTYFDIISRTAEINAEINAQQLDVITGINRVNYADNQAIAVQPTDAQSIEKPTVAIDTASLGGMYAGRIKLVATEKGVGVNVGNLSASQGNLQITADGKIVLGKASATGDIDVASNQQIALADSQVSKNNILLSAPEITLTNTQVLAGKQVKLTAQQLSMVTSQLASGSEGEAQPVEPSATSVDPLHAVQKTGTTELNVAQVELDANSQIEGENVRFANLVTLNNQGNVSAEETLAIEGDTTSLHGDGALQADTININVSTNAHIDSDVIANSVLALNSEGRIETSQSGQLISHGALKSNVAQLVHAGQMAGDTVTFTGGEVIVASTGNISAINTLNADLNRIENSGVMAGGSTVALN